MLFISLYQCFFLRGEVQSILACSCRSSSPRFVDTECKEHAVAFFELSEALFHVYLHVDYVFHL